LYVIGLNNKGVSDEIKDKLFDVLNNFDINFDLYENNYDEAFLMQLYKIVKYMTNNYIFVIEKQLYYVDNYENIEQQHFNKLQKIIKEKNYDWINRINIKKIDEKDNL
jgi:hypothetical protein